ncbi:flagellin [Pseudomonas sp. NA-150]|uniref:flagellin N-terminal helical domain-containing protein n=1 Tax=Pseudomonas sp. NA-150 TaxID=3367525 RepID=UPI0037CB4218
MALTVNTNTASLSVQGNLNRASDSVSTTMARLSSGLRINSAKDDAAGIQIASRLTTQIKGMTVASRNANDGISIIQTAEGSLKESGNILQRMREIAVQSKNGTNGKVDRDALNAEYQELNDELTRKAQSANFGGSLKLLDGSAGILTLHIGAGTGAAEQINVSLAGDFTAAALFKAKETIAAVAADATTNGSAGTTAGEYTRYAIDGSGKKNVLELKNTETEKNAVETTDLALRDANAAFKKLNATDPDYATAETAVKTAQSAFDDAVVKYSDLNTANAATKALNDVAQGENIKASIDAIDRALQTINSSIADLGAKQNRLSSTINDLRNSIQNAVASRGQIQDVDYASETAELTKNQILQQASTAILAQANQLPSAVLKLLQ